jgi:hypothetical protein
VITRPKAPETSESYNDAQRPEFGFYECKGSSNRTIAYNGVGMIPFNFLCTGLGHKKLLYHHCLWETDDNCTIFDESGDCSVGSYAKVCELTFAKHVIFLRLFGLFRTIHFLNHYWPTDRPIGQRNRMPDGSNLLIP